MMKFICEKMKIIIMENYVVLHHHCLVHFKIDTGIQILNIHQMPCPNI